MFSGIISKIDARILRLLRFLLAACLAVPLLAWSGAIFPYTAPKTLAFRVLVELAAVFYFYLALKYPAQFLPTFLFCHSGQNSSEEPESRIKKPGCRIKSGMTISVVVLIFLLFNFLSAIFGADFYNSFWGNLERGMGVWGLFHFAAWFLMLAAVFKERKDWVSLINLSVAVSVLVAATALIQRFGGLGSLLPAIDRVYGLIGNAGVLGSYLLFNIFLAGYLFFESVGWKKWLLASSCLLLIFCLFLTGTRGAWLGLLAGCFACLLPVMFFGAKKAKKYGTIFLVLLFVLAASLFFLRPISLDNSTVQSRLILWQDSWQAWQARPLLGFGSENFEAEIAKYLSPRLAAFESYATDRAHNFIFDYGVTTGWLGLLAYLAMIGAAAWALLKKNLCHSERSEESIGPSPRHGGTQNDKRYFSIILLSLLAAYLVQNFFIFDSFVSYLMLFFVLAMINNYYGHSIFCHSGEGRNPGPGSRNKFGMTTGTGIIKKLLLLFVIGILSFVLYSYNLKPFLAAHRANQILSLPASEAAQAGPLLKEIFSLDTFASPEIAYQAALDYIDKISQNPALTQNEEFYGLASEGLQKNISRSPGQAKNYLALAWLDLYFSSQNLNRISEAVNLGIQARELSPNKKDAYLVLAAAYALSGLSDRAQEIISQATAIDGKIGEEVREYYEKIK